MKYRADDTVSERQLVLALAAGGRKVALDQLVRWRKDGLLPPLASCGVGSGRSYYWREPDILEQATAIHDALSQHGRVDATIVTLWLMGFGVPLTLLRRAWQHDIKLRRPANVRKSVRTARLPADMPGLLIQSLQCSTAALDLENALSTAALPLLEQALAKLGLAEAGRDAFARQLWHTITLTAAALQNSSLVRDASDDHLAQAQRYLRTTLRFLDDCSEDARNVQALAQPIFLYLLSMLHSGQAAVLNTVAARMPRVSRRTESPAAYPSVQQA